MAALVIKDLPPQLHRKLKERAARHHRSMTKEALAVIEQALGEEKALERPAPAFKGRIPLTDKLIRDAKREGRA